MTSAYTYETMMNKPKKTRGKGRQRQALEEKPDYSVPYAGDCSASSSGVLLKAGTAINGYEVLRVFKPDGFSFSAKAKASNGGIVLLKMYKRPGGSSDWFDGFVAHHDEIRRRVSSARKASELCLVPCDSFVIEKDGGAVPLRAFYQVFEWVDAAKFLGEILVEIRANPKAYDWGQRLILAREMMFAVEALHEVGIIHADIAPTNFLLGQNQSPDARFNWRLRGLDFAVIEGRNAPWQGHDGFVGTPGYFSPEHLRGEVPGRASDVFSCALILAELLGGIRPEGPSVGAFEERVRNGRPCPVRIEMPKETAGQDPRPLVSVLDAALNLDAKLRPTAARIVAVLSTMAIPDPRNSEAKMATIEKQIRKKK